MLAAGVVVLIAFLVLLKPIRIAYHKARADSTFKTFTAPGYLDMNLSTQNQYHHHLDELVHLEYFVYREFDFPDYLAEDKVELKTKSKPILLCTGGFGTRCAALSLSIGM